MNNLVRLTTQDVSKSIPVTDSLIVASELGIEHNSVQLTIQKHIEDFKEFGPVEFTDLKSGKRGRPTKVYTLNKNQFLLLVTYSKNKGNVTQYKKRFVKAFSLMETELQARVQTRTIAKTIRHSLTDSIRDNVSDEGNFKKFAYSNYTKLVYKKVLGMKVSKIKEMRKIPPDKNVRDYMTVEELEQVQELESKIATYIEMRTTHDMSNKEVYAEVKAFIDTIN